MTIFEFLEARLAEDEAIANSGAQSLSDTWTFDDGEEAARQAEALRGGRFGANPRVDGITSGCRYNSESEMKHIARHDPTRVLREVAAKQAVLKAHCRIALHAGGRAKYYETRRVCRSCEPLHGVDDCWPCPTVLHIAAIYSSHPDYQKEWAL